MRLLQITVPRDGYEDVLEVVQTHELGYTVLPGAAQQEDHYLVQFVVPADAVEHVLNDLQSVGFDRNQYTVSLDAEFAAFEGIDEVQNRWAKTPNKLAPATLRSKAKDLRRNTRSYVWMMVLSAVVAAAGLLSSSPAVVVGAMVIAPIVSPAMTAAVGAVRNDRDMLVDSIHLQAVGLGVAIATATLFALLVKSLQVVPASLAIKRVDLLGLRISPSILSIAIGLSAGAAGAYGLATKGRAAIVGVMIAAALIPTAAAVGIGIAWGNVVVAVGAALLLVLSLIAVNLGGAGMLFYLGYRPDQVDESLFTIETAGQFVVVGGTALLVVLATVVVGAGFYQQSVFERTVNDATTDVLDREEYQELGVEGVTVEYTAPGPIASSPEVIVTFTRTSDRSYPELPNDLAREIGDRTGRDVIVRVQYADYDRSNVSTSTELLRPERARPGL